MRDQATTPRCTETLLLRVAKPIQMRIWTVAMYDPHSDPWSVRLLASGGLSVSPTTPLAKGCYWTISRDLLAAGCIARVGCREQLVIGPVAGHFVRIAQGPTVAHTQAKRLSTFLDRTYAVVAAGTENTWVDADRAAAALMPA